MMNDVLMLYLFTRADSFQWGFGLLCFVAMAAMVLGFVWMLVKADGLVEHGPPKWYAGACVGGFFACFALALLTPTQKDLAIIIGGSYVIEAAKSEKAKEVGGLVYDAVIKQLREAAK